MPTIKQKRAFKEVVKGSTLTNAMEVAGYSPTTAKRTNKLTRTKGWEELMSKELPDGLLAKRHREILNKRETIIVHEGKDSHVELTDQPHSDVKGGLDMAYKLKGKYVAEKHLNVNVDIEANPEIKELTKKLNELYGGKSK